MVSFWIFKFHQNKDQESIEYKQIEDFDDFIYPELSICLLDPFFAKPFQELEGNLTTLDYQRYLVGEKEPNSINQNIDFSNVTMNLFEYIKEFKIHWKNGSKETCDSPDNCAWARFKNGFNGFWYSAPLYKCFNIELTISSRRVVSSTWITFNSSLAGALSRICKRRAVAVTINFPNQFLRNIEDTRYIWGNNETTLGSYNVFKITHMEVIQRRFKQKEPCFKNWKNFDQEVLDKHITTVNCKPPYLNGNARPCVTRKEMEQSMYNLRNASQNYYPKPCKELTNIAYSSRYTSLYMAQNANNVYKDYIGLRVAYPGNIKLITESQLVDIHALIGNIGGYIGLFLGKL